jgi:hypothetical protein
MRNKFRWRLMKCLYGWYVVRLDVVTETITMGYRRNSESGMTANLTAPKWSAVRYDG